jgi:hypothetical protein
MCGLLCFAIPHNLFLCAIRHVDLSVIVLVLPLHFILCGLVDFRKMDTVVLFCLACSAVGAAQALKVLPNAIPDLECFCQLMLAQLSWSLGSIIRKKTLAFSDPFLTLLLEMAVALCCAIARVASEVSWTELVEMSLALSPSFLKRVIFVSSLVGPCLYLTSAITLSSFDLWVGASASILPLAIETVASHSNNVLSYVYPSLLVLGLLCRPRIYREPDQGPSDGMIKTEIPWRYTELRFSGPTCPCITNCHKSPHRPVIRQLSSEMPFGSAVSVGTNHGNPI